MTQAINGALLMICLATAVAVVKLRNLFAAVVLLGIYSLVMALFMGAALTLLSSTHIKIHPWKEMKKSRSKSAETVASCLFYIFCTYAVISSGFTTILFTLTSLYCKTAVGMGTDDRYLAFLDATGMIRYFGFNAFMRSITTFCISFIFSTFLNCEGRLRWVVRSSNRPGILGN